MTTTHRELLALFAKIGALSFGGPAAHIAMMQDEVVTRRKWLTEQRFLDLLGICNLIPGPSSTELAIHIGYERGGPLGLVIAGLAFILPAVLITAFFAAVYVTYGTLPLAEPVLAALKPVLLGVILQALVRLAPRAARTPPLIALVALVLLLAFLGVHELVLLLGAGALAASFRTLHAPRPSLLPLVLVPSSVCQIAHSPLPGDLFFTFAKIGASLFGSGYVLLAFLQSELVIDRGWLTSAQLLDAIAVGQVTPGPVFSTATFIGWVLAGPAGAAAATAGIFLPAFVFVAVAAPFVTRLRSSPAAATFMDGVNAASVALMAKVLIDLASTALTGPLSAAIALAGAILLLRYKISSPLVIAGAALIGLLDAAI